MATNRGKEIRVVPGEPMKVGPTANIPNLHDPVTTFENYSTLTSSSNNEVIEGVNVAGELRVNHSNVTIRNSKIGTFRSGDNATDSSKLEWVDIGTPWGSRVDLPATATQPQLGGNAVYTGNTKLYRANIYGFIDLQKPRRGYYHILESHIHSPIREYDDWYCINNNDCSYNNSHPDAMQVIPNGDITEIIIEGCGFDMWPFYSGEYYDAGWYRSTAGKPATSGWWIMNQSSSWFPRKVYIFDCYSDGYYSYLLYINNKIASNIQAEFWIQDNIIKKRRTNYGETGFISAQGLPATVHWGRNVDDDTENEISWSSGALTVTGPSPYTSLPFQTPPPPDVTTPIELDAPNSITATVVQNTVNLSVNIPDNSAINEIIIARRTEPWASNVPTDGTIVASFVKTSAFTYTTSETLSPDSYYYAAFTKDVNGLYSTRVETNPSETLVQPQINTGVVTYNFTDSLTDGTWYYRVIAETEGGTIGLNADQAISINPVPDTPLPVSSAIISVTNSDVYFEYTSPSDSNRTSSEVWRKTSPWTSSDTTGATQVLSYDSKALFTIGGFDQGLSGGTYYYTIINYIDTTPSIRYDLPAVTVLGQASVSSSYNEFTGGSGLDLGSPWVVNSSTNLTGSSLITLGDTTARARVASSTGTSHYTVKLNTIHNVNYPTVDNARVFYFEFEHKDNSEIGLYITNENVSNITSATSYLGLKYNNLGANDGLLQLINNDNGTLNTYHSASYASGQSVTSNVILYLMVTENSVYAAITDREGNNTIINTDTAEHPFSINQLQSIYPYFTVGTDQASAVDVILNKVLVFENLGESVYNPSITPLKAGDVEWVPGDSTGDYIQTRYDANVINNDPSLPIEYVISVDDVELTPRATSLPITYNSTLAFDVIHQIKIYSNNRSPFPNLIQVPSGSTDAPSLSLAGPANGSSFSSITTLTASASASSGIREVRWFIDSRVVKTDTSSPYSLSINPASFTDKIHTIKVVAVGNNAQTTSLERKYTFGSGSGVDSTNPAITLSGPDEGQIINSEYQVLVEVLDSGGIDRVEFLIDDVVQARATTPSYFFSIQPANLAIGNYEFKVKAYDKAGNSVTETRNFSVTNPPTIQDTENVKGDYLYLESNLIGRSDVLWYGSFNANPWYSSWGLNPATPTNTSNLTITSKNSPSGASLRVRYPGGSGACTAKPLFKGGGGTSEGGTKAFVDISTFDIPDQEELYFRYKVRFDPGFNWVGGGRLPGLGGSDLAHTCTNYASNGWSMLFGWDRDGRALLASYIEQIDGVDGSTKDCGFERLLINENNEFIHFVPGSWHTLEMRVKLNTANVSQSLTNTLVQIWVDGELGFSTTNGWRVRPTGASPWKIDTLMFTTFFGKGSSACNFLPKNTQFAQFDSFALAKNKIGV